MENRTEKQRTNKYKGLTPEERAELLTSRSIYNDLQDLTERLYRRRHTTGNFYGLARECADLRRRLIQGYSGMSQMEKQDISLLVDNVSKYMQDKQDLVRGLEMDRLIAGDT